MTKTRLLYMYRFNHLGKIIVACIFVNQDTLYLDDIEEREDAGTPQNIQKVRAGLAFWIKDFIGYKAIEMLEKTQIEKAVQRLISNPNIVILGSTVVKRQAILSFRVHTSSPSKSRGKPLNGSFVAKLLNDHFGIQARGGCTCAGSYAHTLLNLEEHCSLAMRSFIKEVIYSDSLCFSFIRIPWFSLSYTIINEVLYCWLEICKRILHWRIKEVGSTIPSYCNPN